MMQRQYTVSLLSPAEAEQIMRRLGKGPERGSIRPTLALPGGWELSGEYELTARDARSGEIEWQHKEKNLITDYGRRQWMNTRWHQASINFCPSIETPHFGRYSMSTDVTQHVGSADLTPAVNTVTHTKTFSTTFVVPSVTRTLGMIALGGYQLGGVVGNVGIVGLNSFALLTPPKTQTTTQTLEVVYKVSMNPIS